MSLQCLLVTQPDFMAPGPIAETVGLNGIESLSRGGNEIVDGEASSQSTNGVLQHALPQSTPEAVHHLSRLKGLANDEVHDLTCVGFGPASLAIAIALHDMQGKLAKNSPKIGFLEKQTRFHWHAGMLLPGAKMQISFIKDLATLRDPCSQFTFLNYLKEHSRLVQFSNLGTFLPSRLEFEDYMSWAAGHFSGTVDYGQEVKQIKPLRSSGGCQYDCFEVQSKDVRNGETTIRLTKNVVIAVGGKAARPSTFPEDHARILHSSEYSVRIGEVLPVKEKAYNIAIVGSGQSAAEIFSDLHNRYPHASTRLIIRDTALRPSDDSPFVNEVFNPEAVDTFFDQPEEIRGERIKKDKATNYSVVRLELLDRIYEKQYMQSVHQPDRAKWQHQILTSKEITEVVDLAQNKQLNLVLSSLDTAGQKGKESVTVDAVILATGYHRDSHVEMLQDCQRINESKDGSWEPQRDYSLKLDRSQVSKDMGIWLQGCNESTHGLADSLLSILATRSGELVHSIFGHGGMLNGH